MAQRIIAQIDPEVDFKEKIRPISEDRSEYRFTANADLEKKIKELKGRLAHTHPHISMGELFEMLVSEKLEALKEEKVKKPKVIKLGTQKLGSYTSKVGLPIQKQSVGGEFNQHQSADLKISVRTENEKEIKHPKLTAAEISRQVWARDKHQCTNCESTYGLEEDHIIPKAKGGPYTLENLRLLCRNCNLRSAIKHFGQRKMTLYFNTSCKRKSEHKNGHVSK